MFKHKSKYINTHTHTHTHTQHFFLPASDPAGPADNSASVSFQFIHNLIYEATAFSQNNNAYDLFSHSSLSLCLSPGAEQRDFYRWCRSRPVSNSFCKNTLEGVLVHSQGARGAGFMHSTTQTQPEKPFIMCVFFKTAKLSHNLNCPYEVNDICPVR